MKNNTNSMIGEKINVKRLYKTGKPERNYKQNQENTTIVKHI